MAKAEKKSPLELMEEMEAAHKQKMQEIRQQAKDELTEKLTAARQVVKEIESQMEQYGFGFTHKVGSGTAGGQRKQRTSSALLDEVGIQLLKHLGSKPISKAELAEKVGQDKDIVTGALNKLARDKKAKSNGLVGKAGAWMAA